MIYSLIAICKQMLDVQMLEASSLFSLSPLQFRPQIGISIGWKREPWREEVFAFLGHCANTLGHLLKQALLDRNKEKMCEVFPWHLGCCSLIAEDMRKQWSPTAEAKALTALDDCTGLKLGHGLFSLLLFYCVTSAFRHTAAHSALRLAYYSLCSCACVTYLQYLLLCCEEWKGTFILDLSLLDHSPQEMWVNIYP